MQMGLLGLQEKVCNDNDKIECTKIQSERNET